MKQQMSPDILKAAYHNYNDIWMPRAMNAADNLRFQYPAELTDEQEEDFVSQFNDYDSCIGDEIERAIQAIAYAMDMEAAPIDWIEEAPWFALEWITIQMEHVKRKYGIDLNRK